MVQDVPISRPFSPAEVTALVAAKDVGSYCPAYLDLVPGLAAAQVGLGGAGDGWGGVRDGGSVGQGRGACCISWMSRWTGTGGSTSSVHHIFEARNQGDRMGGTCV